MRVQRVQHARDGAVIDRLVGAHRLGVVLLNSLIHVGELFVAVADIGVAARRGRCRTDLLGEDHAQKSECCEDENYYEERASRTTSHFWNSLGRTMWRGPAASERSIACETSYAIRR